MSKYSNTANRILDVAQSLIQKSGYHAISFNDIAVEVGIKKPSVIHHFASKQALGIAVVKRYVETFDSQLEFLLNTPDNHTLDIFDAYCTPYLDFGKTDDQICLCGALAGEFAALPENLKVEVKHFFLQHTEWLQKILNRGLKDSSYSFSEPVDDLAKHILNSLQGALLVKRATGDDAHLKATITLLKEKLI